VNEPATGTSPLNRAASDPHRDPQPLVRSALPGDTADVVAALVQLLAELGGSAPAPDRLAAAVRALIEDRELGSLLVAEAPEGIVGVLAASWQHALHAAGAYCIVQDLWVDPSWRSRGVGALLLDALLERMGARRITRVEVGLPSARFEGLEATEAFYARNGFTMLGPRMRQVIA
jgi:GNAT superfamily N-acetyltransferase